MKFQLYENLNPLQVGTRLPKYLKTAPLPKLDNDKKYCVVVFRQALEVVMSPQLKHALEKIPHDNVPVVAGRNFTQQAYDAVQQANGFVVAFSNFNWTDESYYNITHPRNSPPDD